jgi:hypothetical protein
MYIIWSVRIFEKNGIPLSAFEVREAFLKQS